MDSGLSNWDIIAIIGTVSFALQGGIIAMEEEYDLFAMYLFGMLTSFGGSVLQSHSAQTLITGEKSRIIMLYFKHYQNDIEGE